MKLKQFRYSADNLGYLVYGEKYAAAIDGGAVKDIISFLDKRDLKLKYVTNTHSHFDHTTGNQALLDSTGAEYLDYDAIMRDRAFDLEGEKINAHPTPGHTDDSVVFYHSNFIITGDTLFIGKAGKCFSGNFKDFLKSIKFLMSFHGDTLIYPGHDYVEEYMGSAKKLEPDNKFIDLFLENYDPAHVFSKLEEEIKINPCLRFNDDKMISVLRNKMVPLETEYDRWKAVMTVA